ncbi:cation:dicarboxylate symporter family transporter [Laceyella putida]|uniref:Cation:dicarboxylate symporter family transporter n=1 Tax=Laceyella putida TaxID=110101 RepID=A0ABW2RIE9_9BACL
MKKISLAWQIFIGLGLGIAVGAFFYGSPGVETSLKPVGDTFIRLIKMIVIPLVISTIVVGVAGIGDAKKIGTLGGKTILYFELITTVALMLGILAAHLFQPGTGVDMRSLEKGDIQKVEAAANEAGQQGFVEMLVHIVPSNLFDSLAKGELLPIIFFSVLFGLGVSAIGQRGEPVLRVMQAVADAMFTITHIIMRVAPVGVFALIAVTVSKFGVKSLIPLSKLTLVVYGTLLFFVVVVLGLTAKAVGVRLWELCRLLKDEILLAFTTASSETVLPRLMEKLERYGCPKAITSFVLPTGYTFNLDGSSIYQAVAVVFIAQLYGLDMSVGQQVTLLLTLMVTSKGMAAVPGASLVVVVTTLSAMGFPPEGLAFIAGIDRILDMARVGVNVIGNSLATIIISKWEKAYDAEKANRYAARTFKNVS